MPAKRSTARKSSATTGKAAAAKPHPAAAAEPSQSEPPSPSTHDQCSVCAARITDDGSCERGHGR